MSLRVTSLVILFLGLALLASSSYRQVCTLPKDSGPCYADIPRFYFDYRKGVCRKFVYGGCYGNANNFHTLKECRAICGGGDQCRQRPDPGHCYASILRFFYDKFNGTCEPFYYGGCGGNCNNFPTKQQCQFQCNC